MLSESDFKYESNHISVMDVIEDISLKVIEDVENIEHGTSNLTVAILKKLFFWRKLFMKSGS